jgi:hypothetical protein
MVIALRLWNFGELYNLFRNFNDPDHKPTILRNDIAYLLCTDCKIVMGLV